MSDVQDSVSLMDGKCMNIILGMIWPLMVEKDDYQ